MCGTCPSSGGPKVVLNFPTKRHWRAKSRLEDVDVGLVDWVRVIRELGLRSIAIPPLGAGNGGLNWQEVRPRIVAALTDLPEIDVHLWDPGHTLHARDQVVNTARPEWTSARAAMVTLASSLLSKATRIASVRVGWLSFAASR